MSSRQEIHVRNDAPQFNRLEEHEVGKCQTWSCPAGVAHESPLISWQRLGSDCPLSSHRTEGNHSSTEPCPQGRRSRMKALGSIPRESSVKITTMWISYTLDPFPPHLDHRPLPCICLQSTQLPGRTLSFQTHPQWCRWICTTCPNLGCSCSSHWRRNHSYNILLSK